MEPLIIRISAQEVHDSFAGLMARLRDTSPAMLAVSEIMADAVKRAFENEQDPVTKEPWKPLAPAYQARRRKEGSLGGILSRGGSLRNSMAAESGLTTARLIMGRELYYARIHQVGGTIDRKSGEVKLHFTKKGRFVNGEDRKNAHYGMKANRKAHKITIPQRRYLGVHQDDIDEMVKSITNYILGNA